MQIQFRDRYEAGRLLARKLAHYRDQDQTIVLGLPRGGVPVAFEVARALHLPWDIWPVRKLGLPDNPEVAMGAIVLGGGHFLNQDLVSWKHISPELIQQISAQESQELERRDHLYRQDRPLPDLTGKTAILVDDGIATGTTMRAVIAVIKHYQPRYIVVAVPLIPPGVAQQIRAEANELVTLIQPDPLYSVNVWYQDFHQTTDQEVCQLLDTAPVA